MKDEDKKKKAKESLTTVNEFFLEEIEEAGKKRIRAKIPVDAIASTGVIGGTIASAIAKITTSGATYKIANGAPGFALKQASDGTFWAALKNGSSSKMVKLIETKPETFMATSVVAVAAVVAVIVVEKQIHKILENQKQIISFLENEREAAIEADVKMLSEIVEKYGCNFSNEKYITTHHNLVVEIKRTALKNMNTFKKGFDKFLSSVDGLEIEKSLQEKLDNLIREFKYYRLSLYTYCLSSFLDVLLGCEFKEENIVKTKQYISDAVKEYDALYNKCEEKIIKKSKNTLGSNIKKGVGKVVKFIGDKTIKTKAGKAMSDSGTNTLKQAEKLQKKFALEFESMKDSKVLIFNAKLDEIDFIYNKASEMSCDQENLYLYS